MTIIYWSCCEDARCQQTRRSGVTDRVAVSRQHGFAGESALVSGQRLDAVAELNEALFAHSPLRQAERVDLCLPGG